MEIDEDEEETKHEVNIIYIYILKYNNSDFDIMNLYIINI